MVSDHHGRNLSHAPSEIPTGVVFKERKQEERELAKNDTSSTVSEIKREP